ncbi:hypothetical protein [Vreelandella massiliensis]|uniref:hypothetical protein n=1 Tax=Vreelandella massiliensis TaxID=1816686 RepID=UPI001181BEC4|nr:hypothetical protein [Halomonas massiliensis]
MNAELVRRQYLDAMGVTVWASRYRLPNALETPACEWEEESVRAPESPSQRLHALLDDAQKAEQKRQKSTSNPESLSQIAPQETAPAAVRALLDDAPTKDAPDTPSAPAPSIESESAERPSREPVTFTLSCFCLAGRWLSLHAGELSAQEQQLLANLYRAAGVALAEPLERMTFTWPPLADGPAPEEPLEEAREGVHAFVSGAAGRHEWRLERVLWWGNAESSPLEKVLDIADGQSRTLELPVWQGPTLAALLGSADAKRALWPSLLALGEQWST